MVLQYAMSWAACLAPATRKCRRRWLTVGLGDVHIGATRVTIYIYILYDTFIYIHAHACKGAAARTATVPLEAGAAGYCTSFFVQACSGLRTSDWNSCRKFGTAV